MDSPTTEFLSSLKGKAKDVPFKSMWRAINDLADGRLGRGKYNTEKCAPEGDGIYALKNDQGSRLLFFYYADMVVLTHGYAKKTQKLPAKEKARAVATRKRVTDEFGD